MIMAIVTIFTELLLQAVPSRRHCWWREILCVLLWIIIASAVPATIVLTIKHRTLDITHLGYTGDTIELLRVDGFWYEYLRISQVVEGGDDEHRVQLYLPRCSDVEIHETSSDYVSPYHQHSQKSRQMGAMQHVYLLSGSSVSYTFCMQSNETADTSKAMFFVFNDREKYTEYVYRDGNGKKSVFQYKLAVGPSDQSPICSTFTFTAKKSNYYFMAGQCNGGVTYHYNVTLNTKFLNFKDYRENKSCSALTVNHDCEIPVGTQFLSKLEKYCLLAHIIPRKGRSKLSPTTHLRVSAGKRGEVVAIPVMVIVVGVAGLLVVVVTYCCCCCKKCCLGHRPIIRGRRYTLISV